jgi:uncharacterized MAPEG superfamily protein
MTGDLWALAAAMLLATLQLTLSSVLTLRQLGGAAGSLSVIGAWMFVIARLLYVPAYAFAPPGVRPICWLAAQMGIFTILADLFV